MRKFALKLVNKKKRCNFVCENKHLFYSFAEKSASLSSKTPVFKYGLKQ